MDLAATVDTHSGSYQFGRVLGILLVGLVLLLVSWKVSSSWRNANVPAAIRKKRNIQTIVASLAIGVGGGILLNLPLNGSASGSSDTAAATSTTQATGTTSSASASVVAVNTRTFTPPATVNNYNLLTGSRATNLAKLTKVPSTIPIWFYATHDDSTTADLVVDGGTAKQYRALGSTDPQGTIADAMAGASITNAKSFPAGPLGGSMECGSTLSKSKKTLYLCVWQDDSMFVAVTVANVHTVEQAATITLDLRNAAEKP